MKKYDGYALITGGSSGIGRVFAHELAAQGYNLILVARNKKKLEEASTQLKKKYSVDVILISQDLADPDSTDIIYEEIQKKKIHVGLLINNAGIFTQWNRFLDSSRENNLNIIKIMCLSYTDLTYKFLPAMVEKGNGGIIFISSVAAIYPGMGIATYASAKAFSLKLGVSLHGEYKSKGIDVLSVCPGAVDTGLFESAGASKLPFPMLSAEGVVKKALNALGKDIVLVLDNPGFQQRLSLFFMNFVSYKTAEKLMKKALKDYFNMDI